VRHEAAAEQVLDAQTLVDFRTVTVQNSSVTRLNGNPSSETPRKTPKEESDE
jgi:hypothetical protein